MLGVPQAKEAFAVRVGAREGSRIGLPDQLSRPGEAREADLGGDRGYYELAAEHHATELAAELPVTPNFKIDKRALVAMRADP